MPQGQERGGDPRRFRTTYSDAVGARIDQPWNPLRWWQLSRAVRRLVAEQDAAIPPELRPPAGNWLESDQEWLQPLSGTLERQEVLKTICQIGGYEARPTQPMRGRLAVRRDDQDVERVAALVGSHVVGFLDETASAALRSRIQASERRGKSVWADVVIDIEDGRYVPLVATPKV